MVVERRSLVGGAAVTEQPWGPDYRVTMLSYVVSLLSPAILRDLDLARHGYKVYPQGPYFVPYPDGRSLQLPTDHARRHAEIAKFSAADAEAIDRWDAWLHGLADVLGPLLTAVPPKLGSTRPRDLLAQAQLAWKLKGLGVRGVSDVTRLFSMSVADLLEDYFESPQLQGVLSVSGVIGTWAGPRSPGTAFVMAHHQIGDVGHGELGSWGFPAGGMGGLTAAMASAARSLGAEIRTDCAVERITTAGGAVTGVALAGGEQLTAPIVVTTAHPTISFLRLLDRDELPADFVADIERWNTRSGTVKVNVAVDRLPEFAAKPGFDPEVHGGTIVLARSLDEVETAFQDAVAGRGASRPFADICIPSVFDPTLAPEGHHIVSMFSQWVPQQWAGSADDGRTRRLRRPPDRHRRRGRAGVQELDPAPRRHRSARDGARVRADRWEHLPRRVVAQSAVPPASGGGVRRLPHTDPRPLPGRIGDPRRRRGHRDPSRPGRPTDRARREGGTLAPPRPCRLSSAPTGPSFHPAVTAATRSSATR